MGRYEQSIHIDAAPNDVWQVLTDVASWPSWTPTTLEAEPLDDSPFAVGKQARLKLKGAGTGVWTVTRLEPERYFAWENDYRGVHTVAGHRVEPQGSGVIVTLSLETSGLMAKLFAPMIGRVARENLPLESEGLKRRCETKGESQYAI
jgi:uncharacterized protein YndB with AHSA1/START domain